MVELIINSVKQVSERKLCVGCGVCASICPYGAVKIVKDDENGIYKSVVSDTCKQCGLCVEVCFGIGEHLKLSLKTFGKDHEDPTLGTFLNCYVGYACDYRIRWGSTSGGIVTALLLHLLKEGIIDGALVTRMDERKPLEPKSFIAKTESDIVSASGSKYCPVSIGVALKDMMQEAGHFAVVGLPCHIYGIKKAEKIYPKLAEKISFHIGLFCGGTANFLMTEYLLKRLKIKKEEVIRINYRGMGWPGNTLVKLRGVRHSDKRDKVIFPFPFIIKSLFQPYRCVLCAEGFNKFADVSCGDAWLPEYRCDNRGTSIIITRNDIGEQVIRSAYEKGRIQIESIECVKVKQAQRSLIRHKTNNREAHFQLLRTLGKPLPVYNNMTVGIPRPTLANYIHCALLYLLRLAASKPSLWILLGAISKGFEAS